MSQNAGFSFACTPGERGPSVRNLSRAFAQKIRLPQAPRRSRSHSLGPPAALPDSLRGAVWRGPRAGAGRRGLCHRAPAGGDCQSGMERETGRSPPGLPLIPTLTPTQADSSPELTVAVWRGGGLGLTNGRRRGPGKVGGCMRRGWIERERA